MIEFKNYVFITEASARIQHAEDIIFWEGSRGALRSIKSLRDLQNNHRDVTLKWDGSPAMIFGRDKSGDFILTDKSGFTAKGYNGLAKSGEELREMFLSRSGGARREVPSYVEFADRMASIFNMFKQAVPKSYRGFFKGDLLYTSPPNIYGGNYIFKPNIVEYGVDISSDLGRRISKSKAGIVIHREVDPDGNETAVTNEDIYNSTTVLVVPPVTVEEAPALNINDLDIIQDAIMKNSVSIDKMLDERTLRDIKLSNFATILYTYTNSKVDTGLDTLGLDFVEWVSTSPKFTENKKQNIINYVQENLEAFGAVWQIVNGIMRIKDNIINQFDSRSQIVKQSINGQVGGEGYVLAHTGGDIKLVPRETFSKANRSITRE